MDMKEQTKIYEGGKFSPGGISTNNGYIFFLSVKNTFTQFCVKLLVNSKIDVTFEIDRFLKNGGKIVECLDLLWLHKVSLNFWREF